MSNPLIIDALPKFRSNAGVRPDSIIAPLTPDQDDPFTHFWSVYDTINNDILEIENHLHEIARLEDDVQHSTDRRRIDELREERQQQLNQITSKAQPIQQRLDNLKKEIEELENQDKENNQISDGTLPTNIRVQKNHLLVLSNKFTNLISNLNEVRDNSKSKEAQQLVRMYQIAGVSITKDDAEKIVESDPQLLEQNVFQISGSQSAKLATVYNQIAARHNDILEIERSLNELLDLFIQFSILLHDQGRQVDNICSNLSHARKYVEKGVKDLATAKEDQKTGRKCLWVIIAAAVVVIIIVVVVAVVLS